MRLNLLPALLLCSLAASTGCGKGPRHISTADFAAGKSAFDDLEQLRISYPDTKINTWSPEFLSTVKSVSNKDLSGDLVNYHSALLKRDMVHIGLEVNTNSLLAYRRSGQQPPPYLQKARDFLVLHKDSVEGLVQVCKEDAERWFSETTGSTGTCASRLAVYQKEEAAAYPGPDQVLVTGPYDAGKVPSAP